MKLMKSVLLTNPRQLEIEDVPKPQINDKNDVLLKVEAVGVCGSDIHYYTSGRIGEQVVQYPFIIGHECAAKVEAIGKSVSRIKIGQQVVVDPVISCGKCDQCKMGRKNTCRNQKFLGCPGQMSGCLCEYIIMPEDCCYPYNKVTIGQAVLCEPLSIGLYSIRSANLEKGAKIAILGAGPIGLSCLIIAIANGIKNCFVTELVAERIEAAKHHGAVWIGNPDKENIIENILKKEPAGLDVVFECAGKQETIDQAIELLKPGGKLMLIGIPQEDFVRFNIHKMRRKGLNIINVRRQNNCIQDSIDLIETGGLNVDFMITHRFASEQAAKVFDMVANYRDGVIKAIIEF
jgi:L-iditol 2-dehydrogenase